MANIVLPTQPGSIVAPPAPNPELYTSYVLGEEGQWYSDEREDFIFNEDTNEVETTGIPGRGWFPVKTSEVIEFILDEGFRPIDPAELVSDVIPK